MEWTTVIAAVLSSGLIIGVLKSNSQEVIDRLGDIDRRLGDIEGYLNGGFAEWKQNKKRPPKPQRNEDNKVD